MKCFNNDEEVEKKYKKRFTEDKIMDRVYHHRIFEESDQNCFMASLEK